MRHRLFNVSSAKEILLRTSSIASTSQKLRLGCVRRQPLIPPCSSCQRLVRAFSTDKMNELKSLQLENKGEALSYPAVSNGLSADASGSLATVDSTANVQASFTAINPVDVYRAHISKELTSLTGLDATEIYPRLQWTQTLDKGDLVLPVPALRIKGKKPNELAAEIVEKVRISFLTWSGLTP